MAQEDTFLDSLVFQNVIGEDEAKEIRAESLERGVGLEIVMVERGLLERRSAPRGSLDENGEALVDLSDFKVDTAAAMTIGEDMARKYMALPVAFDGTGGLVVAVSDADNVFALDDIRILTGYNIKTILVREQDLFSAISKYYHLGKFGAEEEDKDKGAALSELKEIAKEAPVVKLINLVLNQAVNDGASDVHFEPMEDDLRTRTRIDGIMVETMRSPKNLQSALISRLKIMSSMDIAETRKPQDGRFELTVGDAKVDFRAVTIPSAFGENMILRILRKEGNVITLPDLGFLPDTLAKFTQSFSKPYGEILVTGPTGSGKSTTLYAVLNILNTPEKNIVTIEDPVEYRFNRINQMQINVKAGLTFASGLRSILRADPDIIMVGEIRDRETALISTESALTGHLVLSTLHTNDAPSAVTRLIEMGIEPFLITSALDSVLAQRLTRRLCDACKKEYTVDSKLKKYFGLSAKTKLKAYKAIGCNKCNNMGYRGRIGLFEFMIMSEEVQRLAVMRTSSEEIKKVAVSEGMMTLKEDGLEKVKLGLTSIEEVMRVII
ncbi:MAG: ATPase, T2SS/T4P/T4SS family [Actinomycetota bacterium]|nr:ATPase, T2SS/T4P/T4SS family [Actinomycetota bacterium]